MAKKKQEAGIHEAIDVEVLKEALLLLSGVHEGKVQTIPDPTGKGVNILDDDTGDITRCELTDNPLNRFGSLIVERYGKQDMSLCISILTRVMATVAVIETPEVQNNWVKNDVGDEHMGVHPAIIEAAASHPVNEVAFELDSFLVAVESVAKEKYPNLV